MWNEVKKVLGYIVLPAIFIVWLVQYIIFGQKQQITKLRRKLEEERLNNDLEKVSEAEADAERALDDWEQFKRNVSGTGQDDNLS